MRYFVAIAIVLGIAAYGQIVASGDRQAGEAVSNTQAQPSDSNKVYVLGIEGMSCPVNCVPAVRESLESIPGVRSVEVDFGQKRAVVRTEPDVELTTEQCDKSFQNQGYFVSSLNLESANDAK